MPHLSPDNLLRCLAIFGLVLLCHGGSLGHGFVFDDDHAIVDNPGITRLASIPRSFVDAATFTGRPEHGVMYRPLVVSSLVVNHAVSGLSPWSYHLTNLLLHAAVCLLVWRLAASWTRAPLATAWWAGAVMAVHPIHTQAANYVSARAGMMAALFVVVAALLVEGRTAAACLRIAAAQAAGVLSKSTAVLAVPLLGLRALRRGGLFHPRWRATLLAALGVTLLYVGALSITGVLGPSLGGLVRPLHTQVLTQVTACSYYLWLVAMPVHLSPVHAFRVVGEIDATIVASLALLATILGGALRQWLRRGAEGAFGVLWFYGALGVTFLMPLNIVVSEQRLYLPWAGLSLAGLCLARSVRKRWKHIPRALPWAAIGMLAVLSWQRGPAWSSDLSLWTAAAQQAPHEVRVLTNLASAQLESGDLAASRATYERALRVDADFVPAISGLAHAWRRAGEPQQAEALLRRALALQPDWPEFEQRLGLVLLEQGETGDAQRTLAAAVAADPTPAGWVRLGVAQRRAGQLADARTSFENALHLDPDEVDALVNLGALEQEQAQSSSDSDGLDEARRLYERALALRPQHTEARQNLTGVLILLGSAWARAGDLIRAEGAMARLIEVDVATPARRYNHAEVLYALGEAAWRDGDAAAAQRHWEKARSLYQQTLDVGRSQQRLDILDQRLR
jgi:tetratricopeptide (TPR) repeat protein